MRESTDIHPLHDAAAAERYRALWATSPQRSPFSAAAFAEDLAAAFGLTAEFVFVRRDDVDVAAMVALSRRRGPFREVFVPPYCAYSAVVLAEAPSEADAHLGRTAFDALGRALARRYDLVRLHLPPALSDVRPLQWRGWQAAPLYTYLLRLTAEEPLLASWSSGTRRSLAKSRADFTVAEEPGAAALVAGLCAVSYRRQDAKLATTPDVLAALIGRQREAGSARLFVARDATEAAAAGLAVLHDGRRASYWVAGSRPGPAMTVLLGEVLPRLHADGLETLDFGGANTPSIAEFKRRFGPALTPYYRLESVPNPFLRLLLALRR